MHVMMIVLLTLILSYRSVLRASNFNGDLSKWDTSKVSTLYQSKSDGWSG